MQLKIDSKIVNTKIEREDTIHPSGERSNHLTNGQVYFRDLFGVKRLNQVQLKALLDLESKHGLDNFKAAADWCRLNNFPAGKAISSMTTALPKWGNGKGRKTSETYDRVSPDARQQYAAEEDNE